MRLFKTLDREKLAAVSAATKTDFRINKRVLLPILEDLGWIHINKDGIIEEYIPPIEDVLPALGKVFYEQDYTNVDIGTIGSLSILKKRPLARDALLSELDIPENQFEVSLNYGEAANYFGTFESQETGDEIIWSPFYWPGKVDDVTKFLKRQTYEEFKDIEKIITTLSSSQGKPADYIKGNPQILLDGIESGFFPTVGVQGDSCTLRRYVFTAEPQFGLDPNNDIFEKARLIVGCIRHGQYHASGSKIIYPRALLKALRENRMRSHPYARIQYALLVINGICTVEQHGSFYKVKFIDEPENRIAMDIADEMLAGEEILSGMIEPEINNKLFEEGLYSFSAEQRKIRNRDEKIFAKGSFDRLMEIMQTRSLD